MHACFRTARRGVVAWDGFPTPNARRPDQNNHKYQNMTKNHDQKFKKSVSQKSYKPKIQKNGHPKKLKTKNSKKKNVSVIFGMSTTFFRWPKTSTDTRTAFDVATARHSAATALHMPQALTPCFVHFMSSGTTKTSAREHLKAHRHAPFMQSITHARRHGIAGRCRDTRSGRSISRSVMRMCARLVASCYVNSHSAQLVSGSRSCTWTHMPAYRTHGMAWYVMAGRHDGSLNGHSFTLDPLPHPALFPLH